MPIAGQSPKEVIHTELHKYKHGQLHSGSHHGPLVKNRKQAIAIALSESRKARAPGGGLLGSVTPQSIQAPMGAFMAAPDIRSGAIGQIAGLGNGAGGLGMAPQSAAGAPSMAQPAAGLGAASMGAAPASPSAPAAPAPGSPGAVAAPAAGIPGMTFQSMQAPVRGGAMSQSAGLGNGFMNPAVMPHRDLGGGMVGPPNPRWMERAEARSMLHSGPISSIVPGRTDRHSVHVASGSYVLPADHVSGMGQGNTQAGHAILNHMFRSGPYGSGLPPVKHGAGPPKSAHAAVIPAPNIPKFQSAGGGKDDKTGEPVPVVVAGGEYTIPPHVVAMIGGGDVKRGHRILDAWVLSRRKKLVQELKGLPPPAKA